jgi:pyruvate/2-oxoglutarate/acetoin dehydrogenase E1 component
MRELSLVEAAYEGLKEEINKDTNICMLQVENVLNREDKVSGFERFADTRIIKMPKSEATVISSATGLSLTGMRTIIELNNREDVFLAFSALLDQAAKLRYISGGKLKFPVTYLFIERNDYYDYSVLNSDNPYSFLLHGGMKVVIPSCAYDAKGLLISAIRDDDPVAVFLPTRVLADKGPVPEEQYTIPLGKADIKREGKDITVVATGHLVQTALSAADKLEKEGISVEVFDPRSLLPFDKETLQKSVSKTGRVVIIDDSPITCGFSNFVSSVIAEEFFDYLKAPVKIVARADVPVPFSQPLEEYVLPNEEKLVGAIKKIMEKKNLNK